MQSSILSLNAVRARNASLSYRLDSTNPATHHALLQLAHAHPNCAPIQPLQLLHPPAGIFSGLGYKVHLVIRGEQPLRGFDEELRQLVGTNLGKRGVDVHLKTSPTK
jgi:hypothetical protein